MGPIRHHLFPATLRPTSKTGRAVLAALTMALPVFSVGFGNIFTRTVAIHVNDRNYNVPSHSYEKNRHFVSTHVTITYTQNWLPGTILCTEKWLPERYCALKTGYPEKRQHFLLINSYLMRNSLKFRKDPSFR